LAAISLSVSPERAEVTGFIIRKEGKKTGLEQAIEGDEYPSH
jgi:hypothetical protein